MTEKVKEPESLKMYTLHVDLELPDNFFNEKYREEDFKKELKEDAVFRLYAQGKIGSGYGAKILGITREQFIKQLGKRGINYFNMAPEELDKDVETAQKVSDLLRNTKK